MQLRALEKLQPCASIEPRARLKAGAAPEFSSRHASLALRLKLPNLKPGVVCAGQKKPVDREVQFSGVTCGKLVRVGRWGNNQARKAELAALKKSKSAGPWLKSAPA